jgi:pimeloyl-ACP methyl ester carboxylesterase
MNAILLLLDKSRRSITIAWIVLSATLVALILVENGGGNQPTQESFFVRSNQDNGVVIFVHGVLGDSIDSWINPRTKAYWPDLLTKDSTFDNYDVYVYGYPTPLTGRSYTIDELADNMRLVLSQADVLSQRELIFLSHSMGGLVTRALLLKYRNLMPKVGLLFFYSTPTTGSQLANVANLASDNPQLHAMFPMGHSTYIEGLQSAWLAEPKTKMIRSYCAYEKLATHGVDVVTRQSATNLCTESLNPILEDHISIVKPASATALSYLAFRDAFVDAHKK